MGCFVSTYGIDPATTREKIKEIRSRSGGDVLVMAIKDQNVPGKLCFAGAVEESLVEELAAKLRVEPHNEKIEMKLDKHDAMYDFVMRNTSLTSGHSTFSLAKAYFPRGKTIVKILDFLAEKGWGLAATPNFGGVESRDDKGNVTSCVDWPVFVFYKDTSQTYTAKHLFLAIKDSNIPGKLCAAGPVDSLEGEMTQALGPFMSDVKSEKDSYDEDYDVVWRNTSLTTGMQMMSLSKKYFPKGKNNIAMLQCAYKAGWRCVAAPNFGGKGDSWPCYIFRQVAELSEPPELLFASIKDSNIPGKLCFSGPSAQVATDAAVAALQNVPDNAAVKSEKDSYDEDHDSVVRDVKITTGSAPFSFKLKYFPRCDSMSAYLKAMAGRGFQVVCCPNFGGMLDSWPTFVFEKRSGEVKPNAFLAVKDDNIPGKVCLGGDGIGGDASLGADLLQVLQELSGSKVEQATDDYDRSFSLAYKNTVVTSGKAAFSMAKCYFPHGFVLEAILQVMLKHGWKVAGGPNFGDNGSQWPGMIFEPVGSA